MNGKKDGKRVGEWMDGQMIGLRDGRVDDRNLKGSHKGG